MPRIEWDDYFMEIAAKVAERATCDRKHVGSVLVLDRTILSTGYNGSVSGMDHCDDIGHLLMEGRCQRTVHSEANAIVQAARRGVAIDGATCYVTAQPCWNCFKLLANAGIKRIVFGEFYGDRSVVQEAAKAGVEMVYHAVEEGIE